jgi:PKD repeat protein
VVVCALLAPSHEAQGFPWNCQAATQAPGVGSNGPVTITFGGSGQSITLPAFTCDAIDHTVKSIPGGVPSQLHFVPGPQGIDAQELLALAGIPPEKRSGVTGMQISCIGGAFSFAAGYKRPGQPVTLTPSQIASTSGNAVFIEPNGVPGASWFVDPAKPFDSGSNWFSCLYGWAIEIDVAKAPTLVVPTPVASPSAAAAGTTAVAFSLPSAVTTSSGVPVLSSQLEYSWSFGDGTPSTAYSSVAAATHLFHQAGSFPVTVTVEDHQGGYGLSAPVTVRVTAPQLTVATPSVSPGSAHTTGAVTGTPLSFSTSVTLNGTPDTNSLSYQWAFGNGGTSTAASPTYSYSQPGTYAVTVSVTDKSLGGPRGTTVSSATLYVQVNAASGLTVALPQYSPGTPLARQPVQLSVPSVSLNGIPDTNALAYQWTYGDGTPAQATSGPSTAHTYSCQPSGGCFGNSSAAMFKVTVTVTDASAGLSATSPPLGLTVSDSGTLVVNAPTVDPGEVTLGVPVQFSAPTVTLNGAEDTNFLNYRWSFSDGGSSVATSPSYTFTQTGRMTATVVVTDTAGNIGTSPTTTVLVDPPQRPGTRTESAKAQSITFTSIAPSGATIGGPAYAVAASASSGLPVTLSIDASASSVCRLIGSAVSFTGTGPCVIDADQDGNAAYLPAPQAQQSFAVGAKLIVSAPTATLTTGQTFQLHPPESVTLDGSPDTNGLAYAWTLGDGTAATGPSPIHHYGVGGPVQVSVTVTDAAGNSGTSPAITIQVGQTTPKEPVNSDGGGGTGTGGGTGGGTGTGSGTGNGSGAGSGASGNAPSSPQSTPTAAGTETPAAPKSTPPEHITEPAEPAPEPKPAPTPTVRTPRGLVGYLVQSAVRQKTPTVAARANRSAPTATSGGGGGNTRRSSHLGWVLGVLLVLLILLVGAGLETRPPRSNAVGP